MDGRHFDDFTRQLANRRSRRNVFKLIGGGLLAIGAPWRRDASAKPPPDYCQDKLGGACTANIPCCHGDCNLDKKCGCVKPEIECNERCLNPKRFESDEANCGACGKVCPKGWQCCGGVCTFVQGDDRNNCGGCGKICEGFCIEGTCKTCLEAANEKCSKNEDCCTGLCVDAVCRCVPLDGICKDDGDCCSGNCRDGRCWCAPVGTTPCNGECCTGYCSQDVNVCSGCSEENGRCAVDDDCCGSEKGASLCVKGTCLPVSSKTTCSAIGAECRDTSDCCIGLCTDGLCRCLGDEPGC